MAKDFCLLTKSCRLPADTYSDVINIGLPSLRGRAGGEAFPVSECKVTMIFALPQSLIIGISHTNS